VTPAFVAPEVAWAALTPILLVLGAGVVGVLVEALAPQRVRRPVQLTLARLSLAGALLATAVLWGEVRGGGIEVLGGSFLLDGPTLVLQGVIALIGLVALLVIADRADGEDAFAPSAAAIPGSDYEEVARRRGLAQTEAYPLVLFALGGMMIFPGAGDLLTLFIALEVLSLPLYLLSGMARRRRLLSQEAAMKYFLLGAFSSGFFLFGAALVYGFAGSVRLADIGAAIGTTTGLDGLLLTGLILILVGLLFKVGAVPFHAWTPDVYQGAPTAVTGFMAACTKIAAFGAVLRLAYVVLPPLEWDVMPVLWAVAAITMLFGTVVAIVQTDVKRMLAYSSVAHAGFILVGVVALTQSGISSVLFYLLAYGFATVGAFGVVSLVREVTSRQGGAVLAEATHVSQWSGLGQRHPLLAGSFALFLLSFAGIPLTAGFTGKFAVFSAAVEGGLAWLAVIGVLASAAAVFFYVRLIVLMFFTDSVGTPGASTTVVRTDGLTAVAIGLGVVGTVLLGVLPSPVLGLMGDAAVFIP
jgi:NADH-quinone oxidoreductase subunit N